MVQTYKPEKEECMPDKRIFLARAGAKYSTLARDQLIKKINSLFLEAYDQIDPVVWYSFFEKSELPKELIPDTFENVGKITIFLSTLGKKIDMLIEYYSDSGKTFESLI
ncbi:MAG TPA: methionine synthase, partial [Pseudothermotoga sp.]|nr:methionine synthase [Pseudothermotoga sp.]